VPSRRFWEKEVFILLSFRNWLPFWAMLSFEKKKKKKKKKKKEKRKKKRKRKTNSNNITIFLLL